MKVAFISTDKSIITGENGDSWQRHREYARHFDKLDVIIFSLKSDKLRRVDQGNLSLIPTGSINRWWFVWDSVRQLKKIGKVDLISTQDPFITAIVGVISKALFGAKLNIQIHNDFFNSPYFREENWQNRIFYFLGQINLIRADSIRVVNERLNRWKKAFVAPVATNLEAFWEKPHTKRYWKVITVARLAKQKNLPMLFRAAKRLQTKYPKLKFIIVGEGEERKNLENYLLSNYISNVLLVGQKNQQELKRAFAESDLFVLPSNYEGWGISTLEALAAGLPVVVTNTGCVEEVVINKKTGVIINIGDMYSLAKAIVETEDKLFSKSRTYVINGQNLIRQEYTREKLIMKFVNGLKRTV